MEASSGAAATPASLPDAGVLALGASAGVYHDQRRAVLRQVEELDARVAKAREALAAEEGAARELAAGRSRANAENQRLRDGSGAVLDAVRVGGAVWRGLNVGGVEASEEDGDEGGAHGGGGSFGPGAGSAAESGRRGAANAGTQSGLDALRRGQAEARQRAAALGSPEEVRTRLRELAEQLAAARAELAGSPVPALTERRDALERDNRRAERELGELTERRRALESARSQLERQCTEATQREAQQVAALEARKADHAVKERDMAEREEAASRENDRLLQQLEALTAEAERWAAHRQAGEEHLAAAEALIAERAEHKAKLSVVRAERQKVFADKTKVGAELVSAKADLDKAHWEAAHQLDLMDALRREQTEWEELELTKHRLLREELEDLRTEMDALEALKANLRASPETAKAEEELASVLERTRAIESELEEAQQQVKGLQERLRTQTQLRDEFAASVAEARDLEARVSARRGEVHELQTRHDERRLAAEAHSEAAAKLHVYRRAAALLEETAAQEKRIDVGL